MEFVAVGLLKLAESVRGERKGVAFRDVVRECKLDTAVRCLEAGHSPDDAADRAGFSSRRAFDRAFREWTGASPHSFVAN